MLWVGNLRCGKRLIPILKPDNALEQLHIGRIALYVTKRGSTVSITCQAVLNMAKIEELQEIVSASLVLLTAGRSVHNMGTQPHHLAQY